MSTTCQRLTLALLTPCLLICFLACGGAGSSHPDKAEAWVMAQQFVRDRLRSPASADFGSILGEHQSYEKCVSTLGGGRFAVEGWVDAQNSLGVKLRHDFTCRLQYLGEDRWQVEDLVIRQR